MSSGAAGAVPSGGAPWQSRTALDLAPRQPGAEDPRSRRMITGDESSSRQSLYLLAVPHHLVSASGEPIRRALADPRDVAVGAHQDSRRRGDLAPTGSSHGAFVGRRHVLDPVGPGPASSVGRRAPAAPLGPGATARTPGQDRRASRCRGRASGARAADVPAPGRRHVKPGDQRRDRGGCAVDPQNLVEQVAQRLLPGVGLLEQRLRHRVLRATRAPAGCRSAW